MVRIAALRYAQLRCSCLATLTLGLLSSQQIALGQKQLADELIVIGAGQSIQAGQRNDVRGNPTPGAQFNRLGPLPGSGQAGLPGGNARPLAPPRDVLSSAANPVRLVNVTQPEILTAPVRISPTQLPAGGSLERPQADEEGPAEGLTLDAAIAITADQSLLLQSKFQEISKAEADVLTAGLRGNPLVFGSVDDVPYGRYAPARPGDVGYGITIIQPIDINHKRWYRMIAAEHARNVVQAQYQDAVRLEIDNLYTRFVDVLAAREAVRYVEASLSGLGELQNTVERLVRGEELSGLEQERVKVQIEAAELAREDALAAIDRAKQSLAAQLALPAPDVVPLDIRGSVQTNDSGFPDVEQLLELAWANRPDLQAYHLGLHRAQAEVDLAVKDRYPDVFILYTPWGVKDNSATGGQNTASWGVSAMASVPLFNRNQGNIRRAELNVRQTNLEWQNLSRQIESEVRQAFRSYQVAREKVRRLDTTILPRAKSIREKTFQLLKGGQVDMLAYLQGQRDYVEVVRQYRDALVEQRRAALRINTVAGVRIVY
jgi:outer membrane protein, heavy metal efflux system